ncbi:MAG TPA: HEAT repeat domain-containing protein [Reyranella sp.]|nr:HEAT repeat domain-containing protein [Reyranella sp.]
MTGHQLDLFSDAAARTEPSSPRSGAGQPVAAVDKDDAALIAAIPETSLSDCSLLAAEAGRRRLAGAIPALAALCRRFTGFGADRIVPEQAAALRALAEIGGHEAGQAVSAMISRAIVQGPTLVVAVDAAARVHAPLPPNVLGSLLQHIDPGIRAAACRCARRSPEVIALLIGLLDDRDRTVAISAACALGRLGRSDARPALKQLLREAPSRDVVESVSAIADEECMVLLGRLARTTPDLADAAIDALESIDHPRASAIAAAARRPPSSLVGPD